MLLLVMFIIGKLFSTDLPIMYKLKTCRSCSFGETKDKKKKGRKRGKGPRRAE